MKTMTSTIRTASDLKRAVETTASGEVVQAYELTRRRPVKNGLRKSAWFDTRTFARVFPAEA